MLIEAIPIVSSRLRSHAGLGPTFTPRITRAKYCGHSSGHSTTTDVTSAVLAADAAGFGVGDFERLAEEDARLAGDADVAQAVGPIARHLDVDRPVAAAWLFGFDLESGHGQPAEKVLERTHPARRIRGAIPN